MFPFLIRQKRMRQNNFISICSRSLRLWLAFRFLGLATHRSSFVWSRNDYAELLDYSNCFCQIVSMISLQLIDGCNEDERLCTTAPKLTLPIRIGFRHILHFANTSRLVIPSELPLERCKGFHRQDTTSLNLAFSRYNPRWSGEHPTILNHRDK